MGNQVEFGLESISDIAMCGLCVYMYVSPKTGKTKLSLIIIHILVIKKNSFNTYYRISLCFCFASYQLRVAKLFQPLIHRVPSNRTQALEHLLLSPISQTQFTFSTVDVEGREQL